MKNNFKIMESSIYINFAITENGASVPGVKPVDYDPLSDEKITVVIRGIPDKDETPDSLQTRIVCLLSALDVTSKVNVVKFKRLQSRNQWPGLVKLSVENVEQKDLLLKAKSKLKHLEGFSNVWIRGSESHLERLLKSNTFQLLKHLPGCDLKMMPNGRLVPNTESDGSVRGGWGNRGGRGGGGPRRARGGARPRASYLSVWDKPPPSMMYAPSSNTDPFNLQNRFDALARLSDENEFPSLDVRMRQETASSPGGSSRQSGPGYSRGTRHGGSGRATGGSLSLDNFRVTLDSSSDEKDSDDDTLVLSSSLSQTLAAESSASDNAVSKEGVPSTSEGEIDSTSAKQTLATSQLSDQKMNTNGTENEIAPGAVAAGRDKDSIQSVASGGDKDSIQSVASGGVKDSIQSVTLNGETVKTHDVTDGKNGATPNIPTSDGVKQTVG